MSEERKPGAATTPSVDQGAAGQVGQSPGDTCGSQGASEGAAIDDGGAAFARNPCFAPDGRLIDGGDTGMSTRIWLAGRALSHPGTHWLPADGGDPCPDVVAARALEIADALIAMALEAKP